MPQSHLQHLSRLTNQCNRVGWNPSVPLLPYKSEDRQKQRRWIRSMYGEKRVMKAFDHLKMRETCILLLGLMDGAENLGLHVKRYEYSSASSSALIILCAMIHQIRCCDCPRVGIRSSHHVPRGSFHNANRQGHGGHHGDGPDGRQPRGRAPPVYVGLRCQQAEMNAYLLLGSSETRPFLDARCSLQTRCPSCERDGT